ATQPLRERLHKAHIRDVEAARQQGLITDAEANELRAAAAAVAAAVAVDDFAPEAISPRQAAEDVIPVKWNPFKRQTRSRRSSLRGGWCFRCRRAPGASDNLGSPPPPFGGGGGGGGERVPMNLFASPVDLVACPLPIPPPQAGEGTHRARDKRCGQSSIEAAGGDVSSQALLRPTAAE